MRKRDLETREVSIDEVKYDRVEDPADMPLLALPAAEGATAAPTMEAELAAAGLSSSDAWVTEQVMRGELDKETMQHDMAVLRMLGGQSTILGPRQHGFMYLGGRQGAASSGVSKRSAKRAKAKAAKGK